MKKRTKADLIEASRETVLVDMAHADELAGSDLPLWAVVSGTRLHIVRAHSKQSAAYMFGPCQTVTVTRIGEPNRPGCNVTEVETFTVFNEQGKAVKVTIPDDEVEEHDRRIARSARGSRRVI